MQYRLSRPVSGLRLHFVNVRGTATPADRVRTAMRTAASSLAALLPGRLRARGRGQAGDRAAQGLGGQGLPAASRARLRHGQDRLRPPHGQRERLHARGGAGDRPRDLPLSTATPTAGTTSATTSSSIASARSTRAAPAGSTSPWSAPRRRATTPRARASPTSATSRACQQTPEALAAMARLIRWKLPLHGIPTSGSTTLVSAGGLLEQVRAGNARARQPNRRPSRRRRHCLPGRRPLCAAPPAAADGWRRSAGRCGHGPPGLALPEQRGLQADLGVERPARRVQRRRAPRRDRAGPGQAGPALEDAQGPHHRIGRELHAGDALPDQPHDEGPLQRPRRPPPRQLTHSAAARTAASDLASPAETRHQGRARALPRKRRAGQADRVAGPGDPPRRALEAGGGEAPEGEARPLPRVLRARVAPGASATTSRRGRTSRTPEGAPPRSRSRSGASPNPGTGPRCTGRAR